MGLMRISCIQCGESIPEARVKRSAKTCGAPCSRVRAQLKYIEHNPASTCTTGKRGAISELLVAAKLMAHGMCVFRAMSPDGPCDLIVLQDGELIKVEVKTAHYSSSGNLMVPQVLKHYDYNVLAMVTLDGDIIFEPPDVLSCEIPTTRDRVKFQLRKPGHGKR